MPSDDPHRHDDAPGPFERWRRAVSRREQRKLKARAEGDQGVWFGLGMMGLVGWSVALPTLIGIALGRYIDGHWPSRFSWTLMLMVGGLILGCVNAWKWIEKESKDK